MMNWFTQLSLTRRVKDDHSTCTTDKPLPATPENKDTVDFMCTFVCCQDVKVDNSTNLFKPRQVVVEKRVLASIPGKCDYFTAMTFIENEAFKVFNTQAGSNGAGVGVEAVNVDMSKMWRSEALVKSGKKGLKDGGVGLDRDNWEAALRLLRKPGENWQMLVAFHERTVVDTHKKESVKWPNCSVQ
ncbi:hypothetical protein LTR36_000200 [Oleoguttula mirabilis]|uniref:Uncharacterized protein n=1 Tax=Oleoguttula mirabilis TaxID=1507867 RepID=A0AAV9JXV5_9PEZI|nr:hypothetical protein LTR36_000200 [Oleoguttula mirabilis]